MATFGEGATSKSELIHNCEELIDAKDIDEAYAQLCKEEVLVL